MANEYTTYHIPNTATLDRAVTMVGLACPCPSEPTQSYLGAAAVQMMLAASLR